MDKFEKFLMALGGIALMVLFAFPQVIGLFFAFALLIIIGDCFIGTYDKIKKH
jgi:hypothetical protein